ncbi:putative membrane protein [Treponema primitia ZAS-2]|uniref:Putative membrane protein n=1 Tax=Treponema primitia (strain ATCC BAA-887 / DSM 12427 / ZAS-2) TaxID=545694 RepID=F5YQ96_TREPZ|nr:O-antigen polysaccharide polymerase Wzy [Treponema primitia]AEF85048.1 putative membrane protein [Treponema primitia ZAS-2]
MPIYYTLMPLMFFGSLLLGNIAGSTINFTPIIMAFLFFYFITLIKAIYIFGIFSLYPIYLYTSFFFVYTRLYFHVIGYRSFLDSNTVVGRHIFNNSVGIIFICIIFLSHYIIDIFYTCSFRKINIKNELIYLPKIESCGLFLMILFSPAIIYKLYLQFLYVSENGYVSMYLYGFKNISYPFWTKGSGTFFLLGYLLILFSYPAKKIFIFASIIYFIYALTGSLKGSRGTLLVPLVAIIFFYYKLYHSKISFKMIMVVLIFFVLFSIGLGKYRGSYGKNKINASIQYGMINSFFYGQGSTIDVPLGLISESKRIEKYRHFPFIFSALLKPIFFQLYPDNGSERLMITLEKYNNMPAIVTYILSPKIYLTGQGLGGSVIAEMYDCGKFVGIIAWSLILGFIIKIVDKILVLRNRYIPFCWFLVNSVIGMPRDYFFSFSNAIPYMIIIFVIINLVNIIFSSKQKLLN